MIHLLGFVAATITLLAYKWARKYDSPRTFDWSVLLMGFILVPTNILAGSWFGAYIAAGFALFALQALRQKRLETVEEV